MGEHSVRIRKVVGSNPIISTQSKSAGFEPALFSLRTSAEASLLLGVVDLGDGLGGGSGGFRGGGRLFPGVR